MFLIALDSLENLDEIWKAGPDGIIVGVAPFCARTRAVLELDELADFVRLSHQQGVACYLNMQAMVEEENRRQTEEAFAQAIEAGLDGIYVADDAYLQMAADLENKTGLPVLNKLIIQPETLLCSAEDARFFIDLGVQAASLSHELSLGELNEIVSSCPNTELLIAGRYSWMESRRPLLQNYLRHIETEDAFKENEVYTLRELNRPGKLPVWQDHLGTHVLGDEVFQAGEALRTLSNAGLDRFRIDALLNGNDWAIATLDFYRQALDQKDDQNDLRLSVLIESTIPEDESLIRKEKNSHA